MSAKAISFDDNQYLTENMLVQNPSWTSAKRFLSEVFEPSTVYGYYQPLTMISLMFDYALGGRENNLAPFHRTSLVLHTANTALIIVLLYLLFENAWTAAAAGLLFGVHPMTVEPIPWVGERKTLLAAFFSLWCLIFYVRYVRTERRRYYIVCLVTYILALMSKPTSTPLPLVMLLMDFWPLNRIAANPKRNTIYEIRNAIFEKLPFFGIGALSAVITYISQSRTAVAVLPGRFGFERVPLVLCHNIIFYLYKMIWPVNLSSNYAFPEPMSLANPKILAGVIGTVILIALLIISLRRTRAAFTGWLIFFVAILPTMQVIGFSNVIASDKFAYLPSIGLLMLLCYFLVWPFKAGRATIVIVTAVVLMLTAAESFATRRYLVCWRDTVSLFEYMQARSPDSESVQNMLGFALSEAGKTDEAIGHFHRALNIRPDDETAYNNLGTALQSQGRIGEAISCYRQALRIRPNYADAHNNLGNALKQAGRLEEAVEHFREAVRIKPYLVKAYNNLGIVFLMQGKLDEAVNEFRQSLKIKSDDAEARYNLGVALQASGRPEEAVEHFRVASKTGRGDIQAYAYNNLGAILQSRGEIDKAINCYRCAAEIEPNYAAAHYNLGILFLRQGKTRQAITEYRRTLQIDPNHAQARKTLENLVNSN